MLEGRWKGGGYVRESNLASSEEADADESRGGKTTASRDLQGRFPEGNLPVVRDGQGSQLCGPGDGDGLLRGMPRACGSSRPTLDGCLPQTGPPDLSGWLKVRSVVSLRIILDREHAVIGLD
jgi:hypothetical protein